MNTFDLLGDMPSEQRTIMRLFLRKIKLSMDELQQAISALPEEKQMSQGKLEEMLALLIEQKWIEQINEGKKVVYVIAQIHGH